jgi:hypothetical protein
MSDGWVRSSSIAPWNWTRRQTFVCYSGASREKGGPRAGVDGAMKFRDASESGGKPERKITKRRKKDDPGVDQWFTRRIHEIYDPVLHEKIPDDLSRLLDDFAKRPDGKTE